MISHFEKGEPPFILVSNSLQAGIFFSFIALIALSARILPREWDSRTARTLSFKVVFSSIPNIGSWLLFLPLGLILGLSFPLQNSPASIFFPKPRTTLSPNAQNRSHHSHVIGGIIAGFISSIFFVVFIFITLGNIFTNFLALFFGGMQGLTVKLLHREMSQKTVYVAMWTFLIMLGFPFLIILFFISFGISTTAVAFTAYFVELIPVLLVPFGQGALAWFVTHRRHGSFIPSLDNQNQTSDVGWFAASLIMLNALFVPLTILDIGIRDDELSFGNYSYTSLLFISVYVPFLVAVLLGMSWDFRKERLPKYLLPIILFSISFQMIFQITSLIAKNIYVIFSPSSPFSFNRIDSFFSYYALAWASSVVVIIVAPLVFLPLGWIIGTWTVTENPNNRPRFLLLLRKRLETKQENSPNSFLTDLVLGILVIIAEFLALIFTLNQGILFMVLVFSMWLLLGLSQEERKITSIRTSFLLLSFYIMLHFVSLIVALQFTEFQGAFSVIDMTMEIIFVGAMIFLLSTFVAVPGYVGGIFLQMSLLRLFKERKKGSSEEDGSLMFFDFDL